MKALGRIVAPNSLHRVFGAHWIRPDGCGAGLRVPPSAAARVALCEYGGDHEFLPAFIIRAAAYRIQGYEWLHSFPVGRRWLLERFGIRDLAVFEKEWLGGREIIGLDEINDLCRDTGLVYGEAYTMFGLCDLEREITIADAYVAYY